MWTVSDSADVVTMVSLLIGACVAVTGLNTWKRESRSRINFDLARRCLISLYRFRSVVFNFQLKAWSDIGLVSDVLGLAADEIDTITTQLNTEFEHVRRCREEIMVSVFEARAVWGKEIADEIEKVLRASSKLELQVIRYSGALRRKHKQGMDHAMDIIIEFDENVGGSILNILNAQITKVEQVLGDKTRI